MTFERYAAPIQNVILDGVVPEKIATHFETAKNLALYAWFVYRFIPVAELHAFISVEFALRDKTGDQRTSFAKLLEKQAKAGALRNERFSQWHRVTEHRRRMYEHEQRLSALLERPAPDGPEHWNYVQRLVTHIPWFRNTYAHGSSTISPWAYRTLEDCGEIINQLYEPQPMPRS